jgi:glutamate-1-semialdehyde 2,1-aminomutase
MTLRVFDKSRRLQLEANDLLPGGTNSGARATITRGIYEGLPISTPSFFERAKGSRLFDVDKNEYIDYHLGFGPIILGHANQSVNNAVRDQIEKRTVFGETPR